MKITDLKERNALLDITKSWAVKAPAGSGKTTVLLKRDLKLLKSVNHPSEIIYLTHTNKAVDEMKARVRQALLIASKGKRPDNEHDLETYELACDVLKRNEEKKWNLLETDASLNIMTADAFNKMLLNLSPISSGANNRQVETSDPDSLYSLAALNTLARINHNSDEISKPIAKLLSVVSTDVEKAKTLIMDALRNRDQWLPIVVESNSIENTRQALEGSLRNVIEILTAPIVEKLSMYIPEIKDIMDYCEGKTTAEIDGHFKYVNNEELIGHFSYNKTNALGLVTIANFLLTSSGKVALRKTAHKSIGFPNLGGIKDKVEKETLKEFRDKYKSLLEELAGLNILGDLEILLNLPTPNYSDDEWNILEALLKILPVAVAELKLVFEQKKVMDFSEMATLALDCLGSEDDPKDLLLKMDKSIKHILVDEFQDTNFSQLALIKRLTAGWVAGDGRTLTLVGDPMQSIYMFRGAIVGLFANVLKNGIGDIDLQVVELTTNFRSQKNAIERTNQIFSKAMPKKTDLNLGAIEYTKSTSFKEASGKALEVVYFDAVPQEVIKLESEFIVNKIDEIKQSDPKATIAVLGRARSHLSEVVNLLKSKEIGYQAVNVLDLKNNEVVMDLISLTKALHDEDDQLAWTDLLHSPMVGLSLNEILPLTPKSHYETIYLNLNNREKVRVLSEKAKERVKRIVTVIKQARRNILKKTVHDIVFGAFVELGGLSAIRNKKDKAAVDNYLCAIKELKVQRITSEMLDTMMEGFKLSESVENNAVKIMTIHSAKGLEFDYVFIPQCHKVGRVDGHNLIVSDVFMDEVGGLSPVVAPFTKSKESTVYNFVRQYMQLKTTNETSRLAYVGGTRDKYKLFLSGAAPEAKKGSDVKSFNKNSLFNTFAPTGEGVVYKGSEEYEYNVQTTAVRRELRTYVSNLLPQSKILAEYRGIENINNDILPEYQDGTTWKRIVGTVIHELLEMYSINYRPNLLENINAEKNKWLNAMKRHGVPSSEIFPAMKHVETCIVNILKDRNGQWILKANVGSKEELALSVMEAGRIKNLYIDKVFEDDNSKYVIDYKSGVMREGESESQFITRMLEDYEYKMTQYSKVVSKLASKPVKTGLYLLAIGKLAWYDESVLMVA